MTQTSATPAGPYASAIDTRRAKVQADYAAIMAENPGASVMRVYAALAEEYGISVATVIRYVKRTESEGV